MVLGRQSSLFGARLIFLNFRWVYRLYFVWLNRNWLAVSNIFYTHPDPWGNDPIWRAYFSDGLVQPPTRKWTKHLRNSGCIHSMWCSLGASPLHGEKIQTQEAKKTPWNPVIHWGGCCVACRFFCDLKTPRKLRWLAETQFFNRRYIFKYCSWFSIVMVVFWGA